MNKISILHPSWGRPKLAAQCLTEWMRKARRIENIQYILCLSEKDPMINEYLSIFNYVSCKIEIIAENGLVKQVNHAATKATGDLLIAVSDDFGCPDDWDIILLNELYGKEDYIVKTKDGLQPTIITLPIMDRAYYNRLGYIYHPSYHHMFADQELAEQGALLNRVITIDQLFPHDHYTTGKNKKDETNIKNDSFFESDKLVFEKRKAINFDVILLSILIPTIGKRKDMYDSLINNLKKQIGSLPIEIITEYDEKATIGTKRNRLLKKAKGEYIAFVDDDDILSDNYIALIIEAIKSSPDCCSLNGIITVNGLNPRKFIHSIKYVSYYEEGGIYYRPPNHLNTIKRSIAIQFEFPENNFGEDTKWAMKICRSGLLKTETKIEEVLYYYKYIRVK